MVPQPYWPEASSFDLNQTLPPSVQPRLRLEEIGGSSRPVRASEASQSVRCVLQHRRGKQSGKPRRGQFIVRSISRLCGSLCLKPRAAPSEVRNANRSLPRRGNDAIGLFVTRSVNEGIACKRTRQASVQRQPRVEMDRSWPSKRRFVRATNGARISRVGDSSCWIPRVGSGFSGLALVACTSSIYSDRTPSL